MGNITENYFLMYLGFFIAGLAVNLTPCVYPMLSVTASLFRMRTSHHHHPHTAFFKALTYVMGMVVTYSTLGFLAASSGKLFGAALQNKWVLSSVGLMMIALALSMFGVFQLRLPDTLLNKLAGFRKVNYVGFFISGMLVGVFAAPCIGPPVLALLAAVANNGNPYFGLSAFFVFSIGLGIPYLLLGTYGGSLSSLPKAGAWLIWVERVFGVVLLGFGILYLSLAFNIKQHVKTTDTTWATYDESRLKEAIDQQLPVVIDFYATWCLNCHELEHQVFSKVAVKDKLSQVVALRVDATHVDDPVVDQIVTQYDIIGLPTVIFLNRQGQEVKSLRVEGVVSEADFIQRLESVLHE